MIQNLDRLGGPDPIEYGNAAHSVISRGALGPANARESITD